MLKVVRYYDLSVLTISVMGFQKKGLDGGWVGGVSSIQFIVGYLDFWAGAATQPCLTRLENQSESVVDTDTAGCVCRPYTVVLALTQSRVACRWSIGVARGGRGAMPPQTFVKCFFFNELMLLRSLNVKCKKNSGN